MTHQPTEQPMLTCVDLWKVFGPNADHAMLKLGPRAPRGAFHERGLIIGACNVNLDVRRGEIFIVMGLSGSGKSTLVRCMSGLYEPTHGKVIVEGVDIARLSAKELVATRRNKMSMVFQDFALLPHLTVLNNVAFPLRVQGVDRRARREKALEMIELVGLQGREDYYPDELSGGQQQRVGIARSLTTQPDVWFLDEPFSALDPLIRHEMQAEFLRLQSVLKKSIVFITHDFEEAIRLADRMAIMKDGEIIQQGTPEDLVMRPASDYVREFTQHVPKQKVLRVRAVMNAGAQPDDRENPVLMDARLGDVTGRILEADGSIGVIDSVGVMKGAVHRKDLLAVIS